MAEQTNDRAISEEDRRKAQVFFDRGKTVADTGNFDFAIEMYLLGLEKNPEAIDAHQALREISLKRKASGGKDLGMLEKMKLRRPGKDEKANLVAAEKLLSYDPGNTDVMVTMLQSAMKQECFETARWIAATLLRANADSKSPDFQKYVILKNVYKELKEWKLAVEACGEGLKLRPEDIELLAEHKNLGARRAMAEGGYEEKKRFIDSVKDLDGQQKLMLEDKDVRSMDHMVRAVHETEAAYRADPSDGKLSKFIDAMVRTEDSEYENKAIEFLDKIYAKTKRFAFRHRIGQIKISQMQRMERSLRLMAQENPEDQQLQKELEQFQLERCQMELAEFRLCSEAYPTDFGFRYEIGERLFRMGQFMEAIPVLQQARQDPKYRAKAGLLLGRAFYESSFPDEAVDTIQALLGDYAGRGDEVSKEMQYWLGRSFEMKNDREAARKCYSQVAQWDFAYRDVQTRLMSLRSAG